MTRHDKISKIDRYRWASLDLPGEFSWIRKEDLVVPDESYQRNGTDAKELRIASRFSWSAFQTISVSKRSDGRYNVIDGGHRLRAAMRRDDVKTIPCMVFHLGDDKGQAEAFLSINRDRKPMSGVDRHKAMLVAGDPMAEKVENAAMEANRPIAKSSDGTHISCVNEIARCIKDDEAAFNRVWKTIYTVCENRRLTRDMLLGLFWLERFVDGGISSAPRARRVLAVGYDALYEGSRQGREFHGNPGAAAIADGMLKKINKGLRQKWEVVNGKS